MHYRLMTMADIGRAPIDCQGTEGEVRTRIADLGASAILAFDGEQHVGQLQFRRYDPSLRSPSGIMDPLYWGDFGHANAPSLPSRTLNLFCYHVGQLESGDARDPRYHGRGIGIALLKEFRPSGPWECSWAATPPRSTSNMASKPRPAGATVTCETGSPTFWPRSTATNSVRLCAAFAIRGSLSTRWPK